MDPIYPGILLLTGVGLVLFVYPLAAVPLPSAPKLGALGIQRRLALERSGVMRAVDPLLRLIAAWVGEVRRANIFGLRNPMRRMHDRQADHLTQAGYYLGLTPDEYTALSFLTGLGGLAVAVFLALTGVTGRWLFMLPLFGLLAPRFQVNEARGKRQKQIRRGLPAAIDLAAMCMAGGLDFPGALRTLVANSAEDDLVAQELSHLLTSLELGHTRKQALQDLERRVPIETVRNFCRALIQAEEKGNPIVEALRIQAKISRMQRSIMAEEAAARAAAMLMFPMVLLMCCIFIMLMGPFFAGGFDF